MYFFISYAPWGVILLLANPKIGGLHIFPQIWYDYLIEEFDKSHL